MFCVNTKLINLFVYNSLRVVVMPGEKKKVGRPRIHATNAERYKAYYERKKAKMRDLENKLKNLEEKQEAEKNKKLTNTSQ